jgi:2-keto-4-pentenoate hydratase/2-oxohepta-3-ene-1,7-dioic acid hydratase in catechol pathway
MKLLRYGPRGQERPGILDGNGVIRDLGAVLDDIVPERLSPASLAEIAGLDPHRLPAVPGSPRLGVPITGIGKIVAVGLNYRDHAAEAGLQSPKEPVLFMKATSALNGPNDDVVIPPGSTKLDWEVELVIVIGRVARGVPESDALGFVAGYCVGNDVSERAFQIEHGGQWTKGKSADTFAPLGPYLVCGEVDPSNLDLWLAINGREQQRSNTSQMTFGAAALISYISRFMTLMPGDVIYSGTPAGVGLGRRPPVFLEPGDVMTLGIEGLGTQRQKVIHAPPPPASSGEGAG